MALFSGVKRGWLFLSFVLILTFPSALHAADIHESWDQLLKRHVHEGFVDYQGMKKDVSLLNDYLGRLQDLSEEELTAMSREERMAFWLNLYHATVIRLVLENAPLDRFDQIPAVFTIRKVRVSGQFLSLAEIRDQILRGFFRDERILTALVSARMDSPKLYAEAFTGEKLNEQLNEAATSFVEDNTRNEIIPGRKKVVLSPLFRQFQEDFLLNFGTLEQNEKYSKEERAIISFILEHLKDSDKRLYLNSSRYKIKYLPESSVLNDISRLPNKR